MSSCEILSCFPPSGQKNTHFGIKVFKNYANAAFHWPLPGNTRCYIIAFNVCTLIYLFILKTFLFLQSRCVIFYIFTACLKSFIFYYSKCSFYFGWCAVCVSQSIVVFCFISLNCILICLTGDI